MIEGSSSFESADLVPYLLGFGPHAYPDRAMGRFERLHEAARVMAALPDPEATVLRLATRLAAVDRTLAALLVAATRECGAAAEGWSRLSDEAYLAAAKAHGKIADFLCFWDWFLVPATVGLANAAERHRLVRTHLLGLAEGDERAGVRASVLSLFEGTEEQAAVGLAFCNNLHVYGQQMLAQGEKGCDDPPLHRAASSRLLYAAESGELAAYTNEFVDLSSQVVAALGRWEVDAAYPSLERMLRQPPPAFSPLARAHLRRAVLQLTPNARQS